MIILNIFIICYSRRSRSSSDCESSVVGVSEQYGTAVGRESTEEEGNHHHQQHHENQVDPEDPDEASKRVAAVQVQVQGMEGDWRAYCEHPLSVATAAMLNLQQQHQVSAVSGHPDEQNVPYVYEYYKLPEKSSDVKLTPTHELWPT